MNIQTLIDLLKNKISSLQNEKNSAYMRGDIESFDRLNLEIEEVEKIVVKLQS